ncbi:hypothetical protein K4K49_012462 [Colletotrichum sp. SAR 10_70]|nr:hypothetical protein K4K50_011926 [Colletotrichum sp. SAR 10_71]KAI8189592.1 hypothetical protein K4K49_012462 [Colletotrichum sp. SAR 10_70]KAI8250811.1 hypothetical protein K4K53_012454 [Colletotrichum sp. SAR 10_77]
MAAAGQSARIVVVSDTDSRSISDELLNALKCIAKAKDTVVRCLHPLPNYELLVLRVGTVENHIKLLRRTIAASILNAELARENQVSLEGNPLAPLRPMRNLETGDPISNFPATAAAFWSMSHNDMRRICAALEISTGSANGPVRMELWKYTVHYDPTD